MLKVHVLDQLHHHRSNVAHGVEVPAGARLLFTNGQVGTKPDGSTPEATAEQVDYLRQAEGGPQGRRHDPE